MDGTGLQMEGRRLDDFLEALQRFRRRSRLSDAFQSASRNSTGKLYRVEFLGDFILSGTFFFLEGKQSRCAFQATTLAVLQCQMFASEDFILGLST